MFLVLSYETRRQERSIHNRFVASILRIESAFAAIIHRQYICFVSAELRSLDFAKFSAFMNNYS
jgi:hypothetical protein